MSQPQSTFTLDHFTAVHCPKELAEKLVAKHINWLALLALASKYGPTVWAIVTDLIAGKPIPDLVVKYGPQVYEIVQAIFAALGA